MRIIKIFLLPVLFPFCASSAFGQDTPKVIKQIRREFNSINRDSTFKKVVLEGEKFLDHATDGGGELTGFYKNDQIRKIIRWVGLSNGNEILEFYFRDSQLIFVYEQFSSFVYDEKRDTLRLDTTEITFEGRYYFFNGKLLDYVTKGHNRFEDDSLDPGKILLIEANEYKNLLALKRK